MDDADADADADDNTLETPDLVTVAKALADQHRVEIVMALMDGRPMPATRLAAEVGVAASTASAHLRTLVEAGILTFGPSAYGGGRYRFYRIASAEVAELVEAITTLAVTARGTVKSLQQGTSQWRMRTARMCYDHLAGRLGVALVDGLIARDVLVARDGALLIGTQGESMFQRLDVDLDALRGGKRPLLRPCVDMTEQRPHLAGALGGAIASQFERRGWIARSPSGRMLDITPGGERGLRDWIHVEVPSD